MLEPYRMIIVNCLILIGFTSGLFFFKYVYPKKKFNYLFLILLLSLLPLISLLRAGVYESGDFAINVIKTMSLYQSLLEGIFPVRWSGDLNATYGYPLFLFTYPLPYYAISFFHFLGFSFIASHKLALVLPYLLSGAGMYLFLRQFTKPLPSFAGAVFYQFAPYHLVDLHYRVALGEVYAFAFLPYLFYFLKRFYLEKKVSLLLFACLAYSLLILSHQAVSLAITPFVAVFILLESKNVKDMLLGVLILLWGLLLSCFYWLPVIFERQFTYQLLYTKQISFEPLHGLLFSQWRYGLLFQGPKGELSYMIGYSHLLVFLTTIYFFFASRFKKTFNKYVLYSVASLLFLFFLLTPWSQYLWNTIPLIGDFQFSTRLLVIIAFFLAFLSTFVFASLKNIKIILLAVVLTILITILNWGNRTMITDITDTYLESRIPYSTAEGEGLQPAAPKWANTPDAPWFKNFPRTPIEFISGTGSIQDVKRSSIHHSYIIRTNNETVINENTAYFPGWRLYVNNKKVKIGISKAGTIQFLLPSGQHTVDLKFENTPVRSYSENISLAALLIFIFTSLYLFVFQRRK